MNALLPIPRPRPVPATGLAEVPTGNTDAVDLRTGKILLMAGGAVATAGTLLLMTVNPSKSKATVTTKKIAYFGLLAGAALTAWGLMDERARTGVMVAINKLRGG